MPDRRTFLLTLPVVVLASSGLKAAVARPGHADRYADLVGDHFTVIVDNTLQGRVQLVAVRRNDADARLEQFSLQFRHTDGARLAEGCHVLLHPRLGRVQYFLQSRDRADGYCAGFCLLRA